MADEMFKTAMRGFDKEEVLQAIQRLKDDAYAEKVRLTNDLEEKRKEIDSKDEKIEELQERLAAATSEKDRQIEELQAALKKKEEESIRTEKGLREKYQSYVDHYDTIGDLILEARIKADQTGKDAENEKTRIIAEAHADAAEIREKAEADAKAMIETAQKQVDEQTLEGKQKYAAVQEELNQVVAIFNQVQRQFMQSHKTIQNIVSDMPDTLSELDNDEDLLLRDEDSTFA